MTNEELGCLIALSASMAALALLSSIGPEASKEYIKEAEKQLTAQGFSEETIAKTIKTLHDLMALEAGEKT